MVLQSLEDIPESIHNSPDEEQESEREDDSVPNKPVSMNGVKLAPLCSISEVALDSYDWTMTPIWSHM
jgi:hypothetical protein